MLGILVVWVIVSLLFVLGRFIADDWRGAPFDTPKKGRIKTNLNAIGLVMNIYDYLTAIHWKEKLRPKTPVEKEIAEELKEIEQLEQQKVKMEELEQLRARKDRLFEELEKKKTLLKDEELDDFNGWPTNQIREAMGMHGETSRYNEKPKEKVDRPIWVYSPDDTEELLKDLEKEK